MGVDDVLVGVEEEYLVVDPGTRAVVPRAGEVLRSAMPRLDNRVSTEITQFQVEAKTMPCRESGELREQLLGMRKVMSTAARGLGLAIVASGTPVLGQAVPPPITDHPRYAKGLAAYRSLHDELSVCAGHVHVAVADRERAIIASNHIRPWLPLLIATMANSPFWLGRDTGYASWRTLAWGKWPVAGAPPYFSSVAEYDALVQSLSDVGALVDPGTIFWDIRPSAHLPTVEIRVSDVPATVRESVLLAMLVRGLVMAALGSGHHGPRLAPELLRVAYWRAARDGLGGLIVDPDTGRLTAAAGLLDELARRLRAELEARGDFGEVTKEIEWLRSAGGGAARQRAAYARRGNLGDVVDCLIRQTTA